MREKYLKSGMGKQYLKNRLKRFLSLTGFTLIELLVIMAIIGIIISFLVPAIGKVKDNARRAQCINNLRQIGMAFYLYLDDHDEMFPPGGSYDSMSGGPERTWEDKLKQGYIDDANVFICHAAESDDGVTYNENYYGYNGLLGGYNGVPEKNPKKLNYVITPSATILCADAATIQGTVAIPENPWGGFTISDRHLKGANILFVSGAVQWFSINVINVNGNRWWGDLQPSDEPWIPPPIPIPL